MSDPKHRKNALVKTEPRIQPAGRHVGDRLPERLGGDYDYIKGLFEAAFVGNPFRGRA